VYGVFLALISTGVRLQIKLEERTFADFFFFNNARTNRTTRNENNTTTKNQTYTLRRLVSRDTIVRRSLLRSGNATKVVLARDIFFGKCISFFNLAK